MNDMQKHNESLSISNLNGLIKQNKNEDFKSLVSSVNRSCLINTGGKTLMHTAAETSNIDIIAFLIVTGFDIDAQNARGQTPLHLTVLNSHFQAMQLLLSLDADILIADSEGTSTLKLCFQDGYHLPEYVKVSFLHRLKRSGLSAQEKREQLDKVGCSILQAFAINDTEVIGLMLDRISFLDRDILRDLLKRAMDSGYMDSVRALVTRGPKAQECRGLREFLYEVKRGKDESKKRFYLQQLIDWDIITEDFLEEIMRLFNRLPEREIQIYLDAGINKYVRRKFGWEMLVDLLDNNKVDCLKLIKNKEIDVNGRNRSGNTMLHKVVLKRSEDAMVYLLGMGADPNVKNDQGRTPLFYCSEDKLKELLLDAGADVQTVDNDGETIIDLMVYPYCDRVVAEICILEAKGLLRQELVDALENQSTDSWMKCFFKPYRQDIDWMKNCQILDSFTLFKLLADKVEDAARYVKSEDDVDAILQASRERNLQESFVSMLTKKLKGAVDVYELRLKAAAFLSGAMEIDQADHLVIENIISFLTYRDLQVFDEMEIC